MRKAKIADEAANFLISTGREDVASRLQEFAQAIVIASRRANDGRARQVYATAHAMYVKSTDEPSREDHRLVATVMPNGDVTIGPQSFYDFELSTEVDVLNAAERRRPVHGNIPRDDS